MTLSHNLYLTISHFGYSFFICVVSLLIIFSIYSKDCHTTIINKFFWKLKQNNFQCVHSNKLYLIKCNHLNLSDKISILTIHAPYLFWLETLQFSSSSQKRNILWSIWKWLNSPSIRSIFQHFYSIKKLHFLLHFAIMVPL